MLWLIVRNMIVYCILWNNIASYDFILRDIILYCILWNNFAYYKLILCTMIDIAQYDLFCVLWNNIASYNFVLLLTFSYRAIWVYIASCEIILSYNLILPPLIHIAQYDFIMGNSPWFYIAFFGIIMRLMISYCTVVVYIVSCEITSPLIS